jgi:acyl-CoA reductase-like NAD-dependent aldehyde dehydrogenase
MHFHFINNNSIPAEEQKDEKVANLVMDANGNQIQEALVASSQCHKVWYKVPLEQKLLILKELMQVLLPLWDKIVIAHCSEVGNPIASAFSYRNMNLFGHFNAWYETEMERLAKEYHHEWADFVQQDKVQGQVCFRPVGPVVVLCPTNAPLGSCFFQCMKAIMYGCPVIAKPSPYAATEFSILAEALSKVSLPPGLFQILQGGGNVGKQLVESPLTKAVCFTGSSSVGFQIAATCGLSLKRYHMELSGVNPFIVCSSAKLPEAAKSLVTTLTLLNGQYCMGTSTVYLHESIREEFVQLFVKEASLLKFGDPLDETTTMGPHNQHLGSVLLATAHSILKEYPKSKLIHPDIHGQRTGLKGPWIPPTLIDGLPNHVSCELFGAFATIHTFSTMDQVIDWANQPRCRLKSYVFSTNQEEIERLTSELNCNWFDINQVNPSDPGGPTWSDQGGCGTLRGVGAVDFFLSKLYRSTSSQ